MIEGMGLEPEEVLLAGQEKTCDRSSCGNGGDALGASCPVPAGRQKASQGAHLRETRAEKQGGLWKIVSPEQNGEFEK